MKSLRLENNKNKKKKKIIKDARNRFRMKKRDRWQYS